MTGVAANAQETPAVCVADADRAEKQKKTQDQNQERTSTSFWEYYSWALGFDSVPTTPAPSSPARRVPVYVMMPLEFGLGVERAVPGGKDALESALDWLAEVGAKGVMVDVWWGVCEREPQAYDFGRYVWLAEECRARGLQIQATMSFHRCGGNVGDSCNIPLPSWVENAADQHSAWFLDAHSDPARECISLAADELAFLPCNSKSYDDDDGAQQLLLRTPLEAYEQFMAAFCAALCEFIADGTVCELQVGCGPCGELRYPSYRAPRWRFPGVGAFQCYDPHMLDSLRIAAAAAFPAAGDHRASEFAEPPQNLPDYNDSPGQFFSSKQHLEPHGTFFRKWYVQSLLAHLDRMLLAAHRALRSSSSSSSSPCATAETVAVSVKISGVHWFAQDMDARPAEMCTGYDATGGFYEDVARRLAKAGATFNFTCVEMWDGNQRWGARSAPEMLVQEVICACRAHGVAFAGENAIENYARAPLRQIVRTYELARDVAHAVTFLRLGSKMLTPRNQTSVARLIHHMSRL